MQHGILRLRTAIFIAFLGLLTRAHGGTVIVNNGLPANTAIVNINGVQDGLQNYNGDQSLWYKPIFGGGATALLTYTAPAGTYEFRVVNPSNAVTLFPGLSLSVTNQIFTGWTYNSPWLEDYIVSDNSAAANASVPQLFDGAPTASYGSADAAYAAAVSNGLVNVLRVGVLGRDSFATITNYTFAAAETLIFAVPDYGLSDNGGGVSVVIRPATGNAPTNYIWNGSVNNDWANAANWTPAGPPGLADVAVIGGGTPIVSNATVVGSVIMGGGTLNAGAGLTATKSFSFLAGTVSGTLTNGPGSVMTISNTATMTLATTQFMNFGTVSWLGGAISLPTAGTFITNNGTWNIQGAGALTATGSAIFCNNGGVNFNSGTTSLNTIGFVNAGAVNVNGGTLTIGVGTDLGGTFAVASGTLNFNSGFIDGAFATQPGGSLVFQAGAFTDGKAIFSGGGTSKFASGTLLLTNDVSPNLLLAGGTVTVGATFQNAGAITSLTLSGATLAGANAITGIMNWQGGTISGALTISNGGGLYVNGSAPVTLTGTITNGGQIVWNGAGNWSMGSSASINNLATGVFDVQCDQQLTGSGAAVINNGGLFRKSMGLGTTYIGAQFNNSGTVSILTGTFQFGFMTGPGGTFNAINGGAIQITGGSGAVTGAFNAGFGASITFNGGNFVNSDSSSFAGVGNLAVVGGSMTLTNTAPPNLRFAGGTLTLAPTFQGGVITNLSLLNGQTYTGSNYVTGVFNLNGTFNGPVTLAPGAVMNWYGGSVAGPVNVASGATLNMIGTSNYMQFQAVSTNAGTINWSNNSVYIGSSFYNLAGGKFYIDTAATLYYANYTFYNAGLIEKTVNASGTEFYPTLQNSGVVQVDAGGIYFGGGTLASPALLGGQFVVSSGAVIYFQAGGNLVGTFAPAAGANIYFDGGYFTNTPSAVFGGPGTNSIIGGYLTLSNDVPGLQYGGGGNITFTPGYQGGTITNLTLNGNLGGTNTVTGVLNLNGGINGPLTLGPNAVLNWSGGTMNVPLTIPATAVVNLVGTNSNFAMFGAWTNLGTINWYAGSMGFSSGSFNNMASGTLNIECNSSINGSYYDQTQAFNNAGLAHKFGPAGTTYIGMVFHNLGQVTVDSGSIEFEDSDYYQTGTINGTYQAALGTTVYFEGTYTNPVTAAFNGPGVFALNGGTMTLFSNTIPNFTILGGNITLTNFQGGTITNLTLTGTLSGSNYVSGTLTLTNATVNGPLTVAGTLNWSGGQLSQSEGLTILTNGVANLYGGQLFYSAVTNYGTVNWLNGYLELYYQQSFYNMAGGVFDAESPNYFYNWTSPSQETFYNYGTFERLTNSSQSVMDPNFQNAGALDIEAGAVIFENPFYPGGTVTLGINALNNYGKLQFSQTPTFSGTLNVNLNNGFQVASNNTFALMTYPNGGPIGSFAGVSVNPGDDGQYLLTNGTTTMSLIVTNVTFRPQVSLVAPLPNAVDVLPTTVTVSASSATADLMDFYADGELIGVSTGGGVFTIHWAASKAGLYALTAVAIDGSGAVATSAPVNVLIAPAPSGGGSLYTWTGGGGSSSWTDNQNWSPTGVPGATDDAVIFNGTAQLPGNVAIDNLYFGLGSLQGPGGLTVHGRMLWTGGSVNCALTVAPNGILFEHGGTNTLDISQCSLFISAGATNDWQSGALAGDPNSTTITNQGLWAMEGNRGLKNIFSFVNTGLLVNAPGTNAANGFTNLLFTNTGTVIVSNGTFTVYGGPYYTEASDLNGPFTVLPGATLALGPGYFLSDTNATFGGGGASVMGNSTYLEGILDISTNLQLNKGQVTLSPFFQANGAITNLTIQGSCTLFGSNTVSKTLNALGGYIYGPLTVAATGTLNVEAPGSLALYGALINNGVVDWTGGGFYNAASGMVTNNGLWLIQATGQEIDVSVFVNNGTIRQTNSSSTTYFWPGLFFNNGLLDVASGTVSLSVDASLTGSYNVAPGASLEFGTGTLSLGTTFPTITGGGSVYQDGASITLSNDVDAQILLEGGALYLGPAFQKNGAITNLTLAGSTLYGSNVVTGVMNWTDGEIVGGLTVAPGGTLNISGSTTHYLFNGGLTNNGTVNWTGGEISYDTSASIVNNGLWLDDDIGVYREIYYYYYYYTPAPFFNNGIYRKVGMADTTYIYQPFTNAAAATVDIQSGQLYLANGGQLDGVIQVATNASVELDSGSVTLGPTLTITGQGTVNLGSGTLTMPNDAVPHMTYSGGALILPPTFQNNGAITNLTTGGANFQTTNPVTVTGTLTWTGGTLTNRLLIASSGTLNLSGVAYKLLDNAWLANFGTVNWSGGQFQAQGVSYPTNGAYITNYNLWNDTVDASLYMASYAAFYNPGTFRKSGTTGITVFTGSPFINSGTVDVESGTLSFSSSGIYAQANGKLVFGASGPGLHGLLTLSSNVNFDGTLTLNFINGYVPNAGDNFTLATYPSNGVTAFSKYNMPSLPAGLDWQVDIGGKSLTAREVASLTPNNTLQISGTVADTNGTPIPGVTVFATITGKTANIVSNGSFELPFINGTGGNTYAVGSTVISNWTVVGKGDIDIHSGNYLGAAEDGSQYFDPSGSGGGGAQGAFTQTFPTVAGKSYILVLYHGTYSRNYLNAATGVLIGTNYFTVGETSGGNGALDWREVVYPFTAPGATTTITLSNLSGFNSDDGFIDNVQVLAPDAGRVLEGVTDSNGHYQFTLADGAFQVGVSGLEDIGYNPVADQGVTMNNQSQVVNFTTGKLGSGSKVTITTFNNPPNLGTNSGSATGAQYTQNSTVTLVATVTNKTLPYVFLGWFENSVLQTVNPNYTFVATRDRALEARFALASYTINVQANPAGAGFVTGGGTFTYGTTITMTEGAYAPYHFVNWSDGATIIDTNLILTNVVTGNHTFTANFGAVTSHKVTMLTSPALTGASLFGAGTYGNGQTALFTAAPVVTNLPNYYTFQNFTLNGVYGYFAVANGFSHNFSYYDDALVTNTANYVGRPVNPLVAAVTANYGSPVPATANFVLTFQFDRAMSTTVNPTILLTNMAPGAVQAAAPGPGHWARTALPNDTYVSGPILFTNGMDGAVQVFISGALDAYKPAHALALTNPITLNVKSTPAVLPQVSITAPTNGFSTGVAQNFQLTATATSGNGAITKVAFFVKDSSGASQVGPNLTTPPYTLTAANANAGSAVYFAQATDVSNLVATSAVVHVTFNNPGETLIDFEALNALGGAVSGATLSNYLAGFGVTLSNVTAGAQVAAQNDANILNGGATVASSGDNLLTESGAGAVSYKLVFSQPYASVSWTRTKLLGSHGGAIVPAWRAHAFDANGNEIGSVGEVESATFADVPARTFTLLGPNIASLRFDGNNSFGTFATAPVDDLLLSTNVVGSSLAVNLTSPANNATAPAPGQFTLTAQASTGDDALITSIAFYENGSLVGGSNAPVDGSLSGATMNVGNLASGFYSFTAVVTEDFNGNPVSRNSSPVTVSVTPTAGVSVMNFDALDASAGAVSGATLSNYLAGFGVTLTNVTLGSRLQAINGSTFSGSAVAIPPSQPNLFTQVGLNQPVSFTMLFATPLQSLQFTRAALVAGATGISHPQWTAHLFDANGVELETAGESLFNSLTNVPARTFLMTGTNIASVRFDSDSQGTAAFAAALLDDFVLNGNTLTTPSPLTVNITTPAAGRAGLSPATVFIAASATDTYSIIDHVSLFVGSKLVGTTFGNGPYTAIAPNLLAGTYQLTAKAYDAGGYTRVSAPVQIVVGQGPGNSSVVNFDTLATGGGAVTGAALSNYLAANGITVTNVSAGSTVEGQSQANLAGGNVVTASSSPNILTAVGPRGQSSFTLAFDSLLTEFSFTRPQLESHPFVSHPAWQAHAFDALGVEVGAVGEPALLSFAEIPAQTFTLQGPGIASVEFDSQSTSLSFFNSVLLDDLVLTTSTTNIPPAVVLTNPLPGEVFTAPAVVEVDAQTADGSAPVTNVNFYANGSLIGAGSNGVYTINWSNAVVGPAFLSAVAMDNAGFTRTSPVVRVVFHPQAGAAGIVTPPSDQTVPVGGSVTFSVEVSSGGAVAYQWLKDGRPLDASGANLTGVTSPNLSIFPVGTNDEGDYSVQVVGGGLNTVSAPGNLTVVAAPVFTTQPQSQVGNIGDDVVLNVAAAGGGPLYWQWLLNGSPIPGATGSIYEIDSIKPLDSGKYQVVVGNAVSYSVSDVATVGVNAGGLVQTNGYFSNSLSFDPLVGPALGNNANGTQEPGQPDVDGKPGGNTIWFNWHASFTGVISLTTRGSTFDTLLGVYVGTSVSNLTQIAADDDSGGFFTSLVTFNAIQGTDYEIAVSGFNGATGDVVLGLPAGTGYQVLSATDAAALPVITQQPSNQIVQAGATLTLTVAADNASTYQWYFQNAPISGQNSSTLTITNFQADSVGAYQALVANAVGSVQSAVATVDIGVDSTTGTPAYGTQDKFGDAVDISGPGDGTASYRPSAGGDTRGFSVTHVFSTAGATKEAGEPNPCGQSGGASIWYAYTAPATGTLHVDTGGSSFNTVLAVYTGTGASFASLVPVACGFATNFNSQGQPSLNFAATGGTKYFIVVDGYQGASGSARLHVSVGQPPVILAEPASTPAGPGGRARFTVSATGTTNLFYQWQFNSVNIADANSPTFTLSNAQPASIGAYTVVVSNVIGVVTSSAALLNIQNEPFISTQPASTTIKMGAAGNVTVEAGGATNLLYQWFKNGLPVAGATGTAVNFARTQAANYGTYTVVVSNGFGAVTSALAVVSVTEPVPPTITIQSPANNFQASTPNVTLKGVSSDKYGIASNAISFNGGAFQLLAGSNKWTANLTLVPGSNTVAVQSFNFAGQSSAIITHTLFYVVKLPITVLVKGPGKVTGVANHQQLDIGAGYSATGVPTGANILASWAAGTDSNNLTVISTSPSLRFVMSSNLVLLASFQTNPFPAVVGSYNGLAWDTNGIAEESSGFVTFTVSTGSKGAFSGRLTLDGGSYSFTGTLDTNGDATVTVARKGKTPVTIMPHAAMYPANDQITGTISNAAWQANLLADRAVFGKTLHAANYAGQFTALVPPGPLAPSNEPAGWGYATVNNSILGAAVIAGQLADGSPLMWSVPIARDGSIPVYNSLYGGLGSAFGWWNITNNPPQVLVGNLSWIKPATAARTPYPAGFSYLTNIFGSTYTNQALALDLQNAAAATLTLDQGGLAGPLVYNLSIAGNTASILAGSATNKMSFQFDPKTGIVTITFKPTGSKTTVTSKGVILQDQSDAYGSFLNTNESGFFLLQ